MKYLLDTMVLKEIGRSVPHENVEAWLATVDDRDLAISAISVREIWKGIEKKRASAPSVADTLEAAANRILNAFEGRIVAIDEKVAQRWGALLGQSDKHIEDTGLAAAAFVHAMVLVTRNISHTLGREVPLLDPFKRPARLHEV